jgi:hypothetical protein
LERYHHFQVSKPEWGDRYHIDLAFDKHNCCELCVGIGKSKSAPGLPALRSKLKKLQSGGWENEHWWVWGWYDESYRTWNTPETLERLSASAERERALEYFVRWFVRLRSEAEGDIDAACR